MPMNLDQFFPLYGVIALGGTLLLAIFFFTIWAILPFSIFGIKEILRDLADQERAIGKTLENLVELMKEMKKMQTNRIEVPMNRTLESDNKEKGDAHGSGTSQ